MEDILRETAGLHSGTINIILMKRDITRLIWKIFTVASLCMCTGAVTYAQEYVAPSVNISKDKVRINGKIFYSHVVLEKQTLYSISKAYDVSLDELYKYNPTILESGLKKNSILLIPVEPESRPSEIAKEQVTEMEEAMSVVPEMESTDTQQDSYSTYTVKWYDDLESIARQFGVSEDVIITANNLKNRQVQRRQKLKIPARGTQILYGQSETVVWDNTTVGQKPGSSLRTGFFQNIFNKSIDVVLLLPFKATGTQSSRNNMDFYSGVLMAARELAEKGIETNLKVYDIADGSFGTSKYELEAADIIIGPVSAGDINRLYSYAPSVKCVISPLDPRAENLIFTHKTLIHAPSSQYFQYTDMVSWIKEDLVPGDKLVVISEKGARKNDEGARIKTVIDSSHVVYTPFSYSILEGREIYNSLSKVMTSTGTNRVVIASESEAFVNDVVRNLNLISHNKQAIALYAPSKIRSFETIEVEHFHNIGLHVSMSYYTDYEEQDVKDFLMEYRAIFKTEPSQVALQGYDIGMYFMNQCAENGENWVKKLPDNPAEMLQSRFNFLESGRNRGIRRIIYGKDYSIQTIDVK